MVNKEWFARAGVGGGAGSRPFEAAHRTPDSEWIALPKIPAREAALAPRTRFFGHGFPIDLCLNVLLASGKLETVEGDTTRHPMLGSSMRRHRSAGTPPALPALLVLLALALAGLAAAQRWPQAPAPAAAAPGLAAAAQRSPSAPSIATPAAAVRPPTAAARRSPSSSSAPTSAVVQPPTAPPPESSFSFRNNAATTDSAAATHECGGFVSVTSHKCVFRAQGKSQALLIVNGPVTRVITPHDVDAVEGKAGNPLRSVMTRTFAASPSKPFNYKTAPKATVTVNGITASRTSRLVASRERSIARSPGRYKVRARPPRREGRRTDLTIAVLPAGRRTRRLDALPLGQAVQRCVPDAVPLNRSARRASGVPGRRS